MAKSIKGTKTEKTCWRLLPASRRQEIVILFCQCRKKRRL